jgi:hypothetical protein
MENELVKAVLAWWDEHRFDTINLGDGEEDNAYDEEPEFVKIAKKMSSDPTYITDDGVLITRGKYYKKEGETEIKEGIKR